MSRRGFYRKYAEAIKFNRNIMIAGAGAVLAGALVSQLFAGHAKNDLADSALALTTEYSVYIPVFALLFYIDNRRRYVDPATGKKDGRQIRSDIKKLLATFSVSEVVYSAVKVAAQYQLLQSGAEAYAASAVASLVAWAVFMVAINLMAKATRLFRCR